MIEYLGHIFNKISVSHLNILFLLGLALFGGTIGGRLFQKLRIPQVVGYIAIGIVIGESCLKVITQDVIETLQPFNYFALGLIGFMIGGELKKDVLRKYGKQFVSILLFEGVGAFLLVSVFVGVVGSFLLGDWRLSWSLGLLLGAIASATAPAATTAVLREFKTRGPLTRTVLGIVAMDDGLALILFAIASSIAGSLIGNAHEGVLRIFINPLYEIGGAILVGIISGLVLNKLLRKYTEEARLLAFSIGAVLIVLGVSLATHVDMLLAAMTLGVIVANFIPRKSKEVFKLVEGFTPPIFVLFFVLVGAKLNISHMTLPIVLLGIIYIIGRSVGKAIGASLGARISGAPKTVQKYLPLCLFSQAGVAIGLSILASHYFPGYIGSAVIIIITATAFILEIIGPPFVKFAVTKAGEVGMNITEDDFVRNLKVEEIMDKTPPLIYKNMPLAQILTIFSESPNLYYPVVDTSKKLLGIITVDNIKNTFMATSLSDLLLAVDVMEPAVASVTSKSSISELKGILAKYNLEYLPVVTQENEVIGFIERRMVYKVISTKIMELQRQVDSLEKDS
ncbi:MAG: cation:proton antiporter [Candidatus Omnitrophica bacterium]|nr:cation:proton antiporter [Candidatus Omnitrophota bacterium]